MHIRIHTSLTRLGYDLAADLEGFGLGPVEVFTGPTNSFELRHKPGVGGAEITRLLEAIKPFQPDTIRPDAGMEGVDVELSLGDEAPLNAWEVRIDADSPELAAQVREISEELEFRDLGTQVGVQEADALLYAGAPPFARQVLRWRLKKLGLKVKEQRQSAWADSDDDIWLTLRDPAQAGKPFVERFDVSVRADDPAWGAKLITWLKDAGFRTRPLQMLTGTEAVDKPFQLVPGPFGADRAPTELARLTVLLQDLIADARTDTTKYPLRVSGGGEGDCAEILLPVTACKSGKKRPYSGPYPERFSLRLHTDDQEGIEPLRKALADAGFPRIEVVEGDADDLNRGYAIHWGAAANEPEIAARIRHAVEEAMQKLEATPPFELSTAEQFAAEDPDVWIFFPLLGLDDGSLLDRLSDPSRFKITLHSPNPDGWSDLLATWEKWGFQGCTAETTEVRRPQIDFGGAPSVLLERLRESVRESGGLDIATTKRWDDADTDVWVYLPERSPSTRKPGGSSSWETDAFDVRSWFAHQLEPAKDRHPSFVEITANRVRVGAIWLPRRKSANEPFVPDPAAFAHFCLDGRTAETLQHLALSVALREPCLLEGETSTSKTSSILYLAALLNQPVVRINLNGQTDTGELVGRYVPNSEFGIRNSESKTQDREAQPSSIPNSEFRIGNGRTAPSSPP